MQEWVLVRQDIPKNLGTPIYIIKEQYIETIGPHQEHVINTIVRDSEDFPYETDISNDRNFYNSENSYQSRPCRRLF